MVAGSPSNQLRTFVVRGGPISKLQRSYSPTMNRMTLSLQIDEPDKPWDRSCRAPMPSPVNPWASAWCTNSPDHLKACNLALGVGSLPLNVRP